MVQKGFKRKLTAILSADVEGYSRLMGEDEEFTVRTLTAYREVMATLIQQHNGKVLDSPGDNLLAEFVSVVDAVQCSVAVQKEINARNTELPENRKMQFRIGINLGDVIQEDERIYGDGVNIAARLEGLSEAGGICISKTAFDHIESKLPYGYEFLGDQTVKNIAKPVGAYRVLMEPRVTVAGKPEQGKRSPVRRIPILVGAVAVLALAVALGVWQFYSRRPTIEPASLDSMALSLPDKPSIAILPFDNISGDPEQEFFSDGMTDDIITDLSKISDLFVIARNSVYKYKGKDVDVNKVGRELGVRYVLEGSVRMAGNQVRINAQLIDTATGGHPWAERYEGPLDHLFSLQENITQKIAEVIAVKLTVGGKGAIPKRETDNLEAYLTFLKGWQHYRRFNPDAFLEAIPLFEKAIELDPNYWRAYAVIAKIYFEVYQRRPWRRRLELTRTENYRQINRYLTIALKGPTPLAHEVATQMHIRHSNYEEAVTEAKRAVSLDPKDPDSHFAMGQALLYASRHREAVESFKRAMQIDPLYQDTFGYGLGMAYFFMIRYEKAVELFERAYKSNPEDMKTLWFLSAAYAHLGREREAEATFAKLSEIWPQHSYFNLKFIFNSKDIADYNLLADGLRKAGMK
jgi:TolB-like protein/class 3 adenylate cyclase/lipopolysaccharide biosynthesis regulator YciM